MFFSGKLIHSMVAHLDAVTSLAVDPNGLYLMSGSKYSSWKHLHWCSLKVIKTSLYSDFALLILFHFLCQIFLHFHAFVNDKVVKLVSQVTTAPCVCGTWRARRASRSSPLTGRSSTSPFTTWRFIPPSATSAAREPTPSPKSSYDLRPPTKTASTNSKPEREARADDPGGPGAGGEAHTPLPFTEGRVCSSTKHLLRSASQEVGRFPHFCSFTFINFPFVVSLLT